MHISRVQIENYRNFRSIDLVLEPNIIIVGANKVGKTNFINAIRLALDTSLSPNARKLSRGDFWDGSGQPFDGREIRVTVELQFEEGDVVIPGAMISLEDPPTARLTYRFWPKAADLEPTEDDGHSRTADGALETDQSSEEQPQNVVLHPSAYDWDWYMGSDDNQQDVSYRQLSDRLSFQMLSALRDTEELLSAWSRSPLKPLLESLEIEPEILASIAREIRDEAQQLTSRDDVRSVVEDVDQRSSDMVGDIFSVGSTLNIVTDDADDLLRSVRLFVDGAKQRPVSHASLGTLNVLYFSLLLENMRRQQERQSQRRVLLALEEPEAHVHPHVQRSIFRYFLSQEHTTGSLVVTTHSPHIASVAPLESLVLLRDEGELGTQAYSVRGLFDQPEVDDLERYLDVTRGELVFARGVILVEGVAELYIVPAFARAMDIDLDHLVISVLSVHGTDFKPYAKLLSSQGLNIPFIVFTDGDRHTDIDDDGLATEIPPGLKRGQDLVRNAVTRDESDLIELDAALEEGAWETVREQLENWGIFVGQHTLELDLLPYYAAEMAEVYGELVSTEGPKAAFQDSAATASEYDPAGMTEVLDRITRKGKGRFAQKLAPHIVADRCPEYIQKGLETIHGFVSPSYTEEGTEQESHPEERDDDSF